MHDIPFHTSIQEILPYEYMLWLFALCEHTTSHTILLMSKKDVGVMSGLDTGEIRKLVTLN